MKLKKEIDALIVELTRKGLTPRYIVIGQNQYKRWVYEAGTEHFEKLSNQYLGCDVVICGSDILEVVPEPKELYFYFDRK
ncbi:MAG: hypothetical protein JW864_01000 [Spirochaetes bacterium]|nr:hypothetical protein [Spirochaetota bacterium]